MTSLRFNPLVAVGIPVFFCSVLASYAFEKSFSRKQLEEVSNTHCHFHPIFGKNKKAFEFRADPGVSQVCFDGIAEVGEPKDAASAPESRFSYPFGDLTCIRDPESAQWKVKSFDFAAGPGPYSQADTIVFSSSVTGPHFYGNTNAQCNPVNFKGCGFTAVLPSNAETLCSDKGERQTMAELTHFNQMWFSALELIEKKSPRLVDVISNIGTYFRLLEGPAGCIGIEAIEDEKSTTSEGEMPREDKILHAHTKQSGKKFENQLDIDMPADVATKTVMDYLRAKAGEFADNPRAIGDSWEEDQLYHLDKLKNGDPPISVGLGDEDVSIKIGNQKFNGEDIDWFAKRTDSDRKEWENLEKERNQLMKSGSSKSPEVLAIGTEMESMRVKYEIPIVEDIYQKTGFDLPMETLREANIQGTLLDMSFDDAIKSQHPELNPSYTYYRCGGKVCFSNQ